MENQEPSLIEKPKRKRRTKAEIEADRQARQERQAHAAADELRAEISTGDSLKGKVATAILSLIQSNWTEIIQPDGRIATLTILVQQGQSGDTAIIETRASFSKQITIGLQTVIDDGQAKLPLRSE